MADETDSALVARSRLGDGGAFSALVRRHLRAAIAVGIAVLRNSSDAEDNAQDALMVAYQSIHTCRDPARFAGWLLTIVRTRALNRLKQGRGRAAVNDQAGAQAQLQAPASALNQIVLKEQLLAGLATLTQVQREVVLLHDLESWTHLEISSALEISELSSRQHLFNARKAMRALLSSEAVKEEAENGP